jgi:predicted Zn-ribbon and HTH transcriptional regulator
MKTLFRVKDVHPFTGAVTEREYEAASRDEAREKFVNEIYPEAKDEDSFDALKMFLDVKYISGDKDETKVQRCTTCASEFSELEVEGVDCCPACGDKGVPCSISDDVVVKVNWHELRILGIWAEQWAKKIQKDDPANNTGSLLTVMSIAGRLQNQFPEKPKLTLFSEIRDVKEHFAKKGSSVKVDSNIDNDEELGL